MTSLLEKIFIFILSIGLIALFYEDVISLLRFIAYDIDALNASNSQRITQYVLGLDYIFQSIFDPLFGFEIGSKEGMVSIHNGPLSLIVNLGLFSFLNIVFFGMYVFFGLKFSINRLLLFFIILDISVYLLQPFLLARVHFLPLVFYLSFLNFKRTNES